MKNVILCLDKMAEIMLMNTSTFFHDLLLLSKLPVSGRAEEMSPLSVKQ